MTLQIDIPEAIDGSWYEGQVHVGFKYAVFEPSSSLRHLCELYDNILFTEMGNKSVLLVYIIILMAVLTTVPPMYLFNLL